MLNSKSLRISIRARQVLALAAVASLLAAAPGLWAEIGKEVAVPRHLEDGEEFEIGPRRLLGFGKLLFEAVWTDQEGGGRPATKGNGEPLSDPADPLIFPRDFNRVSAPDSNSCAGCHNVPRSGGGGDIVANVFVLGQRFDFATFDALDTTPTKGAVDELGEPVELQTIANSRNTLGMFGAGYIEMLARQITVDLQAIRDAVAAGDEAALESKGISYGTLAREADGRWDTSRVEGLPATSLTTAGGDDPPSLIIRPFHQAGAVVSLREFSNNAFNHHHGIQSTERFGPGEDPDDDGYADEMTRADITAVTLFQAQLPPPGRVIPNDPEVEAAVLNGEQKMVEIGCTECHIAQLPLDEQGWLFVEPNPFNPEGNLQPGDAPDYVLDLSSDELEQPRLKPQPGGAVMVPAFTDFKLHDITSGPDDPNCEALDMLEPPGSPGFFSGNCRFLTRKLWGVANEPPYFHHGQYTTLRRAIEAHRGEAQASYDAWTALSGYDQDSIIEALKTLQVLPSGTTSLIVDEDFRPKTWPPAGLGPS